MFKLILSLFLLLFLNPVFAKDPDVCLSNARQIYTWTQARDRGMSQKDMQEAFDFDQIPEEYRRQVKEDILAEVDNLYKEKDKTPQQIGEDYLSRCLQQPDYKPETGV